MMYTRATKAASDKDEPSDTTLIERLLKETLSRLIIEISIF